MTDLIKIYRALTGPRFDRGGERWAGVSENQLRNEGMFISNQSSQQTRAWDSLPMSLLSQMPDAIRVEGLPVYLNVKEARNWVGSKIFEGEEPAIAVVTTPLQIFVRPEHEIIIVRTAGREDYLLTEKLLKRHLSGKEPITGECALRGQLELLRQYETFLRPAVMREGRVIHEKGWVEIGSLGEGNRFSRR